MTQLPPKRRQIIRLKLKKADVPQVTSCRVNNVACEDENQPNEFALNCCSHQIDGRNENFENLNGCHGNFIQHKFSFLLCCIDFVPVRIH